MEIYLLSFLLVSVAVLGLWLSGRRRGDGCGGCARVVSCALEHERRRRIPS